MLQIPTGIVELPDILATGFSSGEQTASRGEFFACTVCRRKIFYFTSPW